MDSGLKLQDCTLERPKLFVTGMPHYLAAVIMAVKVAKENGMDSEKIRTECMEAGALRGKEVLKRYFEVI